MAVVGKSELVQLQKKLKTDEAIAKKFGVTRQAIHQLRNKYGIASRWSLNAARDKTILAQFKGGKKGADIAKKFDLSVSQIYRIVGGDQRKKKTKKK